jgi:protocatechuate 3,4-dioxygenase beta subunit
MIAGLAGMAAPATLFAAAQGAAGPSAAAAAPRGGEPLLVSGRVVTPQGAPLQGATLTFADDAASRAITDADGRFMLETATPRDGILAYRITHDAHGAIAQRTQLDARASATGVPAQRDEAGVWRAAFGVTLA